jgi:hypothetical protein
MSRFVSSARVAHFHELQAGQHATAYIGDKVSGNPLIPQELDTFISDPRFSDVHLWWITDMGAVSHQNDSGGEFKFTITPYSGVSFECLYDPVSKTFSSLFLLYDNFRFDLSYKKCSISDVESLIKLSDLDIFRYVRDNVKLNKATLEHLNVYIKRMETM